LGTINQLSESFKYEAAAKTSWLAVKYCNQTAQAAALEFIFAFVYKFSETYLLTTNFISFRGKKNWQPTTTNKDEKC
jgi:hypothetical protein